jgi:hypothetical protein
MIVIPSSRLILELPMIESGKFICAEVCWACNRLIEGDILPRFYAEQCMHILLREISICKLQCVQFPLTEVPHI